MAKEKQESVRETTAKKEETFIKSFRNDRVLEIEKLKERQAVHPSKDRHGSLDPGSLKTRPRGMVEENKQYMVNKSRKSCTDDCDDKHKHDSYSHHDMRHEEERRRGSLFKDLLIRPAHISELEENRRWARSSLYGGSLDACERPHNEPENSHTGKFSQERVKSFMDRRKSSVSFRPARKKSSQVAFSRQSIMTQRKGKSIVQINEEEIRQARRESKMDAMGTCTYVKVRHILSQKQGLMTDVYNQLQQRWLAFGNMVPPKEFSKLAEKYSECKSAKLGGDLGWITRAKPGTSGPFQEVAFTTAVGACSNVFQSPRGFHVLLVEARKN